MGTAESFAVPGGVLLLTLAGCDGGYGPLTKETLFRCPRQELPLFGRVGEASVTCVDLEAGNSITIQQDWTLLDVTAGNEANQLR
jgi:hypothetical protein